MIAKCLYRAASITAAAIFLIVARASASTVIFNPNAAGMEFVGINSGTPGSVFGEAIGGPAARSTNFVAPSGFGDTMVLGATTSLTPPPAKWPLSLIGGGLVALGLVGRKNRKKRALSVVVSGEDRGTLPLTPEQLSLGTALVVR